MIHFSESRHPVFRGCSGLERGDLKSEGKGKLSIHFNGSDETVEVILRTVLSVNQLSVYGAEAEMCEELAWEFFECSKGPVKPVALDNLETMVMPPVESSTDQLSPVRAEVRKLSRTPSIDQTLPKTVVKAQYITTLDDTELDRLKGSCRECTMPRSDHSSQVKGWIRGNTKIGQFLM